MQYLNVSGFWKPSVKSNIFVYFHQHSIGNRNIKVGSGLHLELVHGVPGLGDVDLVVALHFRFSPFDFFSRFFFRSHSFTPFPWNITVAFWQNWLKKREKKLNGPFAP